jgi:hypothetical protein
LGKKEKAEKEKHRIILRIAGSARRASCEEVTATAIKSVRARQVEAAMKEKNVSKADMARRMQTSRAALDRLLDPDAGGVQ